VKTQQAGKRLSGCCGDLRIVEISGGAEITSTSESCVSGQQIESPIQSASILTPNK
jgi:hypothetical protein